MEISAGGFYNFAFILLFQTHIILEVWWGNWSTMSRNCSERLTSCLGKLRTIFTRIKSWGRCCLDGVSNRYRELSFAFLCGKSHITNPLSNSVSDPSHFDVDLDHGVDIWENWIRFHNSGSGSLVQILEKVDPEFSYFS